MNNRRDSLGSLGLLIASDLYACTKRVGVVAFLSGLVFEPGFSCVFYHRLAQYLHRANMKRLGKLLWRFNVFCHSCFIHLDCLIGPGLFLPHPTSIVIGAGVCIGSKVTIYQGVTIGTGEGGCSYPDIKDSVTIYSNAIVFGDICVGNGSVIGAGSIVLRNVPAFATVVGNPARNISKSNNSGDKQSFAGVSVEGGGS